MSNHDIREVAIPVRSVNRANLYPGRDRSGRPLIVGTMSQQAAGFFLVLVDPETGACRQIECEDPLANYTTAACMSRTGALYIGAAHSGDLYRYDPDADRLELLGRINPDGVIFPCRIEEDAEGRIWIASYATADLTRYDPATAEFTRYGRMDEVDMYAYCFVTSDGTVACLIKQTRPHVVVLDPETGEKRTVGPVVDRAEGSLDLFRGTDGLLYIESSIGNYRVDRFEALQVGTVPEPEPQADSFQDGTRFRYLDADTHDHRTIEVTPPSGAARVFALDYTAAGTDIFCLHGGPDACIYGTSVLPERFFRFDPGTGESVDFGVCSESVGEAYSMANLDGLIYISSYPAARVSVYDPARSYRYGTDDSANPRELGRLDDISYRPRSTLAGPGGKVWFASLPDYGMWGGPLAWYDPATGQKKSFKRIVGDASCYTLAWLEELELLAVGTTVQGGSGTTPRVDSTEILLFDYAAERVVWQGAPDGRVAAFTTLVAIQGNRIVGVCSIEGTQKLFRFEGGSRRFELIADVPDGGLIDLGITQGPNGQLFALGRNGVYRIDPESLACSNLVLFDSPVEGHLSLGPVIKGELYFSLGHRLMCCAVDDTATSCPITDGRT